MIASLPSLTDLLAKFRTIEAEKASVTLELNDSVVDGGRRSHPDAAIDAAHLTTTPPPLKIASSPTEKGPMAKSCTSKKTPPPPPAPGAAGAPHRSHLKKTPRLSPRFSTPMSRRFSPAAKKLKMSAIATLHRAEAAKKAKGEADFGALAAETGGDVNPVPPLSEEDLDAVPVGKLDLSAIMDEAAEEEKMQEKELDKKTPPCPLSAVQNDEKHVQFAMMNEAAFNSEATTVEAVESSIARTDATGDSLVKSKEHASVVVHGLEASASRLENASLFEGVHPAAEMPGELPPPPPPPESPPPSRPRPPSTPPGSADYSIFFLSGRKRNRRIASKLTATPLKELNFSGAAEDDPEEEAGSAPSSPMNEVFKSRLECSKVDSSVDEDGVKTSKQKPSPLRAKSFNQSFREILAVENENAEGSDDAKVDQDVERDGRRSHGVKSDSPKKGQMMDVLSRVVNVKLQVMEKPFEEEVFGHSSLNSELAKAAQRDSPAGNTLAEDAAIPLIHVDLSEPADSTEATASWEGYETAKEDVLRVDPAIKYPSNATDESIYGTNVMVPSTDISPYGLSEDEVQISEERPLPTSTLVQVDDGEGLEVDEKEERDPSVSVDAEREAGQEDLNDVEEPLDDIQGDTATEVSQRPTTEGSGAGAVLPEGVIDLQSTTRSRRSPEVVLNPLDESEDVAQKPSDEKKMKRRKRSRSKFNQRHHTDEFRCLSDDEDDDAGNTTGEETGSADEVDMDRGILHAIETLDEDIRKSTSGDEENLVMESASSQPPSPDRPPLASQEAGPTTECFLASTAASLPEPPSFRRVCEEMEDSVRAIFTLPTTMPTEPMNKTKVAADVASRETTPQPMELEGSNERISRRHSTRNDPKSEPKAARSQERRSKSRESKFWTYVPEDDASSKISDEDKSPIIGEFHLRSTRRSLGNSTSNETKTADNDSANQNVSACRSGAVTTPLQLPSSARLEQRRHSHSGIMLDPQERESPPQQQQQQQQQPPQQSHAKQSSGRFWTYVEEAADSHSPEKTIIGDLNVRTSRRSLNDESPASRSLGSASQPPKPRRSGSPRDEKPRRPTPAVAGTPPTPNGALASPPARRKSMETVGDFVRSKVRKAKDVVNRKSPKSGEKAKKTPKRTFWYYVSPEKEGYRVTDPEVAANAPAPASASSSAPSSQEPMEEVSPSKRYVFGNTEGWGLWWKMTTNVYCYRPGPCV